MVKKAFLYLYKPNSKKYLRTKKGSKKLLPFLVLKFK